EAEKTAVKVLVEEIERRTGVRWPIQTEWPQAGAVVVATSTLEGIAGGEAAPDEGRKGGAGLRPGGFVGAVDDKAPTPVVVGVWRGGGDGGGVLFGVGKLLRTMAMSRGTTKLDARTRIVTSPAYPIRGHQLGYRNRANSWDAWDVAEFERYIRELALFGSNCV